MREKMTPNFIPEKPKMAPKEELGADRSTLMESKGQYLAAVKESVLEMFGTEKLPEELVNEMLEIRDEIKAKISLLEYYDGIDGLIDQKIKLLAIRMARYQKEIGQIKNVAEDESGNVKIIFEDETEELISLSEKELLDSLRMYFDSYRLAHNAKQFRNSVKEAADDIVEENKSRQLNFYSKGEKEQVLLEKVYAKYQQAGFTEVEIKELLKTCNLKKLDTLEIHDIKILSRIRDIFSRFMQGDKSKFVGLSIALMVPAFLDGYAPKFLADAFKVGGAETIEQVGIYALLSAASAGGSAFINKQFKDFLDNNFKKEKGYGNYIAENISEFPGAEVGKFGMEKIKSRIANAKSSYEEVLRTLSFDVFPALVTLVTSAVVLYEKSPILAGGTAVSTGLMMAIDKYVHKKGKFWEKQRKAQDEKEKVVQKMEEILNAHMEIILSGEKEKFSTEIEEMLSTERVAMSDRTFLRIVQNKIHRSTRVLNFILAGVASYFAGGTPDKFIASLLYSDNFSSGISSILNAKRRLLTSFRDIVQMETMFNGYAAEEKEKEKSRIGMSEIKNNDIRLQDVAVEMGNKEILSNINLEIRQGSLVSLNGLSGAGKTTLMKVLAGYYKPTTGQVEIGGMEIEKIKKSGGDSIYSKIAYLSQFPYILADSVRNNLTFGISGDVSDSEIREILAEVGLAERFPNLNEKLKGGRGDLGTTSGGETSRIGLARVILKIRKNNSRFVFLDEPTASVDKATTIKIAEIINLEKQKNPDVTFISISHDENFNEKVATDMLIEMKNGQIKS